MADSRATADARRSIPIAQPDTGEAEWQALREPIMNGWLTQGQKVAEFESAFAERHAVKHAIATTSCTTALHLALVTLGVGPDDEVIVPAFTWVSTANAAVHCGATPVFADVDPATYNIDPEDVQRRITDRTRAIIPVHLFGLCADMDALREVAGTIPLIEDAACAVGASYKQRPAGSLGDAAAFSFHPRKIITTGEGGMVATDDHTLAERMRVLRNHGASISEEQRHAGPQPYLLPAFDEVGFNYRMTDLQASVGLVQLGKLEALIERRRALAARYDAELTDLDWFATPRVPSGCFHSYQAYVCMVDETKTPAPRNEMMRRLHEQGIATRPGTHAVHALGCYGHDPADRPVARECEQLTIALPLHNHMSDDDQQYVIDTLLAVGGGR